MSESFALAADLDAVREGLRTFGIEDQAEAFADRLAARMDVLFHDQPELLASFRQGATAIYFMVHMRRTADAQIRTLLSAFDVVCGLPTDLLSRAALRGVQSELRRLVKGG